MPNLDGTGNALDGIKKVGMFLVLGVLPILLTGLYFPNKIVMTLAGAVGCGLMGKFATKGSWKNIGGWAAIGALAGFLFSFAAE